MKVQYSAILTIEAAIEAVKKNGYALKYVKDQTDAICIEAVKRNGEALRYVIDFSMFSKIAADLGIKVQA